MNKVLVLSPHFDDGIVGCGGTISRFLEEGKEIWYVIFAWTDQGTNMSEIENSILTLGIPKDHLIILDYPVRRFNEHRQEILEDLLKFRTEIAPDLVLCHRSDDNHQDHQIVRSEAFRAFKEHSIWGYELPWNIRNKDKHVSLYKRNVEQKIKALNCIGSQRNRRYYDPKRRESHCISRGEEINKDYAEKFEPISDII